MRFFMKSQWFLEIFFWTFFFCFCCCCCCCCCCWMSSKNPEGFWLLGAQACDLEFGTPKTAKGHREGKPQFTTKERWPIGTFENWQFWKWSFLRINGWMDQIMKLCFQVWVLKYSGEDPRWEIWWAFWAWGFTPVMSHDSVTSLPWKGWVFWSILETLPFPVGDGFFWKLISFLVGVY